MTAGDFGWKVGNRIRVLEARKFDSFMAKWAESECSEAGLLSGWVVCQCQSMLFGLVSLFLLNPS